MQAAASGELRLLYVAPERFSSAPFLQAMKATKIGLFVVDEAHCVSQWGHDFRPDYFRLADAARWLQAEAIIASTATATPQVANDIAQRLGLRDPVRVSTGFDRPNLSFGVIPCASTQAKHRHIAAALKEDDATPAIVYAGTRNGAEKLAGHLSGNLDGSVGVYHAGLGREQRATVQRRFMDGELDVVVATNAFGMGIDKANVRTVCHESVPGSIEAYYQEAGRAGRDGLPSRALLFAEGRDKGLHVFFIQRSELSDEAIARVAHAPADARDRGPLRPRRRRARVAARRRPARERRLGARGRRPPRAGRRRAARAVLARPRARPHRGAVRRPRARRLPHVGEGEHAGALDASTAACGRSSRPPRAGARRSCATSATTARPRRWTACRAATSATPRWVPAAPAAKSSRKRPAGAPVVAAGDLDAAIVEVVETAQPAVGRTRTVEILRGGRSQALVKSGHDGLPAYGTFDHMTAKQVMARVDELLEAGRLRSTGGMYPKLETAA